MPSLVTTTQTLTLNNFMPTVEATQSVTAELIQERFWRKVLGYRDANYFLQWVFPSFLQDFLLEKFSLQKSPKGSSLNVVRPSLSTVGYIGCGFLTQGKPATFILRTQCVRGQLLIVSTLFDPMNCNPPGSSVHGIFPARLLEQVAISFSRGSA